MSSTMPPSGVQIGVYSALPILSFSTSLVTSALARYEDLAHVGQVEDPGVLANGEVLVYDAGVLHRHDEPCELDHLAAERNVFIVQRSMNNFYHTAPFSTET
jgi:hypothetical protein